ncbi:hypothetical protein PR048_006259 [Dryococelus australis]|uniref:Mutator-like transposase domain-containing protein n=1 Tax=Dryococelus australis TaxID=614101 RepID=A0ABQ9IAG1_9NEOP|nr:hypothetical protein PR048_006259 [Dryococelus australis]
MASTLFFECSVCGLKDNICTKTPKTNRESMDINDAWVNSMLATGQGFSQLRDSLEMPCMAKETYQNFHKNFSAVLKEVSWQKMQAAGEEAAIAIQAGEVDDDGIPAIAVVTDVLFRSSCLQACIIGAKTKKVVFASTRNSYCCICERASSKLEPTNSHVLQEVEQIFYCHGS